jgi:hypothetical protein
MTAAWKDHDQQSEWSRRADRAVTMYLFPIARLIATNRR